MNWQLCSPIFLFALLESLLNKLSEILKLCHLRFNLNQFLNQKMFDFSLPPPAPSRLFACLFFLQRDLGNESRLNPILRQFRQLVLVPGDQVKFIVFD